MRRVFEPADLMVLSRSLEIESQQKEANHVREFSLYQKSYLPQRKHKIFTRQIAQQFYLRVRESSLIHGDKLEFSVSNQQSQQGEKRNHILKKWQSVFLGVKLSQIVRFRLVRETVSRVSGARSIVGVFHRQ